jgi:hypothetical protein
VILLQGNGHPLLVGVDKKLLTTLKNMSTINLASGVNVMFTISDNFDQLLAKIAILKSIKIFMNKLLYFESKSTIIYPFFQSEIITLVPASSRHS